MLDVRVNGVNIFNPLEGKIDEIIEYFVKFYGEQYRERITDRIKNTTFIFTSRKISPYHTATNSVTTYYQDKLNYINHLLFSSIENYTPKFESKFKTPKDAYAVRYALDNNVFDYTVYDKITDMIETFNLEDPSYPLEDYAHTTIDAWLNNCINRDRIDLCLNKIIDNYEMYYKHLILDFQEEQKSAIKKLKAYDNLIEKVEEKLDARLYNIAEKYLLKRTPSLRLADKNTFQDCVNTLITLAQTGKEYFVENNDFANYEIKIMTRFFKAIGFDLGDDIFIYQNNEQVLDYVFNKDLYDNILNAYQTNAIMACKANPYFNDVLKTIESLNVKGGNIYLGSLALNFVFNNACTGAAMWHYVDNVTNDLKFVCIFPDAARISDNYIIHELNHVIESSLLNCDDEKLLFKTGFEVFETKFLNQDFSLDDLNASPTEEQRARRSTEIVSEIINDYFAVQITQSLKNDKIVYCLGKPGRSAYSACHGLFKNFIEKYKNKLIEFRFSKDPNGFENFVGKENLDKMSRICEMLVVLEQNYDNFMWGVKSEISRKTNIPINHVLECYKQFIYSEKTWSPETQKVINAFKEIDLILDNIEKTNNKKTIEIKKYL